MSNTFTFDMQVRLGEKEGLDTALRWFEDRAKRLEQLEYYQVLLEVDELSCASQLAVSQQHRTCMLKCSARKHPLFHSTEFALLGKSVDNATDMTVVCCDRSGG